MKLSPKTTQPTTRIEHLAKFGANDLNDLCDATVLAIENGGGFGWLKVPEHDVMERFWEGVLVMPSRYLFVARLDDTICGTAQMILPSHNNQAQSHAVHIASAFVAPWARGHNMGRKLITGMEEKAKTEGYKVINLDVRETQTEAISLFEGLGYQKIAMHPHYAEVDGKVVQGFFYYKEL